MSLQLKGGRTIYIFALDW
uniref:Uncharacterized protein n=1 Tax=Arundo donax TaxID=35708 RepID=A0A0A9AGL3_ARUDO